MELQEKILNFLSHTKEAESLSLAKEFAEDHQKIVGAIKSLQSLGNVINAEQKTSTKWQLTSEGEFIASNGSHEAIVFSKVPSGDDGISKEALMKASGQSGKIGMSKALQAGWIKIKKDEKSSSIVRSVETINDKVQENLKSLSSGIGESEIELATINEYKKRKLLQQISITSYFLTRGPDFSTSIEKAETDLTPEMIASGDWKKKKFKAYNFEALGLPPPSGHLHPLLKVRSEFRQIFLEMGFSEMPTNKFVESSFWNFDALFQPQQHPARDAHDTFFLNTPENSGSFPPEYMEKVKKVHSEGGHGSIGYHYDWKEEEAKKNVLRTHTTAVSARMLYALGQKKEFEPTKLFSIDRVFRNETLDATHLAEFHQVEGVIADRGITLGHLIGTMKEFFKRLGMDQLRFKPAYNPYTEPSMEVFAYHPGLKRWVEIGNSGMFRPEMLLPMGLPPDVRVIAWGLSLERPTMIRYGIDNIRDLVGPRVDLNMVYQSPICRIDTN